MDLTLLHQIVSDKYFYKLLIIIKLKYWVGRYRMLVRRTPLPPNIKKALVITRAFFICGFIPQPIPHQTLDLITFDRSLEDYLGI